MFASFTVCLLLAAESWTPELQMKVKSLGDVLPSPDGKFAAWTESSKGNSTLLIAGKPVPDWKGRASLIAFSPDSKYLYWQYDRMAFRAETQGPGKPERLSNHPGNVGPYVLSRDGGKIAFLAQVSTAPKTKIRVVDEIKYKQQLCVMAADASAEAKCVADVPGFASTLDFSPDSKSVVFDSRVTPFADDGSTADIYEADLDSGTVTAIATTRATEAQPHYSPDGRFIVYVRSDDPPLQPRDEQLVLFDRGKRSARPLAHTQDHLPRLLGWSADSKRIYYEEARGTRSALFAMPLDGPPQTVYAPDGVATGVNVNASGTHLGFGLESSERAPEAQLMAIGTSRPERISEANSGLPKAPLGKTEIFWWRSRDNLEIEGLITYPADFDKTKKYPMVVVLHGGPYGQFNESFIGRSGLYPIAAFAAKGYVVFRPNPRASTGYGRDFRFANLKDWGGGDYNDVMTGVRNVVGLGFVDKDRMAVMGWSYGGFLTGWTITHSKDFKAAAIGAGVSNLLSQTGTSDIRTNKIDAFGAPWENQQFYIERSPLTHVKNAVTPTLILGGDADPRVPISQSYEMYHALKKRGIATQMVVYPGALHVPSDPEYVLDIMQRHIDWVEKYVR